MTEPVFFSIVSANYLAYAITLMQSVRLHHPDAPRYVILADEQPADLGLDPELFTLVPVRDIGIPNIDHMAFRYSVLEFNTAVKPFGLRWLAERHSTAAVMYVDPDIQVLSPMVEVTAAMDRGALAVLLPHITAPLMDGKRPDEPTFLRVGIYNLGFIAVGPHKARDELLSWWAERLEHQAYVDIERGMFTDQKWADLMPALFPDVEILRHPGYDVAYWNLPHRPVAQRPDGAWTAAGEPISFIHFSGVDVRHPEVFSIHQNRYDAGMIGGLRPLYLQYVKTVLSNGYERYASIGYAWSRLTDGTPLTPQMRLTFRHRFDIGQASEAPHPFSLPGTAFREEVRPPDVVPLATRLRRLAQRWGALPSSARDARAKGDAPARRRRRRDRRKLRRAMRVNSRDANLRANVIGYFKGEFGVAEAGRALVSAARAADIDVALINVLAPSTARAADSRLDEALGDLAPHPINILCLNADQTERVMTQLGDRVFEGRYNIGLWFWELARFPHKWQGAIDRLDEIWTATEFVAASIAGSTSKPVRSVGIPVDATPSRPYRRSDFDLVEDVFTFLFSFDFNSFMTRKNPVATIRAFHMAFPQGDSRVALVLKSTNGAHKTALLDELQASVNDDPRIRVVDGFMDRDEMYGLESVVDAYVSLHRSEGFGLGLAESMFLGKPVIGTAYGGNMEFMDASNSCLVGYRLIDVQPGEYPFPDGQVWADPDIEQAAYYMRRLVDSPSFAADLGRRGQAHVQGAFSAHAVGSRLRAALTAGTYGHAPDRPTTEIRRQRGVAREEGVMVDMARRRAPEVDRHELGDDSAEVMNNRFVSYAQNLEDVLIWRAMKHVVDGFYIDVGASSPTVDSVTRALYERGWRGINLEPHPEAYDELVRDRPRDLNLQVAAGDSPGEQFISIAAHAPVSTMDPDQTARLASEGMPLTQRPVTVTTLSAVWKANIPDDAAVHLLKIDVEGFERRVILGNDWETNRPWLVVIEATEPQREDPSHDAWEHILIAAEYRFVFFDGLNRYYISAEHSELAGSFDRPPNVFDRYIRASELEASQRAVQAESAQAALRHSRSWQLTRPMRAIRRGLRLGKELRRKTRS